MRNNWFFTMGLAFDIHEEKEQELGTRSYDNPDDDGTIYEHYFKFADYKQPALKLGFWNISDGEHSKTKYGFDIGFDMRLYKNDGKPSIAYNNGTVDRFLLNIHLNPGIKYSADLTEKATIGLTGTLGFGFSMDKIDSKSVYVDDLNDKYIIFTPSVGFGVRYSFIPDHLAVQAGIGADLFSVKSSLSTSTSDTTMPNLSLAAGLAVNFTREVMGQMLIKSSGREISASDFVLLISAHF
jgi:hypothetical protein